jgi:hypothetical protein
VADEDQRGVGQRTPRPARSSSGSPASRSSTASCWETADGVNRSASAIAGRARELRALPRRDVGIALALGAIGTAPRPAATSRRSTASTRASWRTAVALTLASTGLVLVLAGAAAGALEPLGTALELAAAVIDSAYILTSEGIAARLGPLALSTLVCTGAATTLTLGGLVSGDLDLGGVSAEGYGWLAGIAVIPPPSPSRARA